MTRIARLMALLPLLAAPAFAGDGVWTFHERFCFTVDGDRGCSRGTEDFMFLGDVAYYRPDAGDAWTEIGTVTTNGKRLTLDVSRQGIGRLVASRVGVDVSEMLQEFVFTYRGRVAGNRIGAGRARVNLAIEVDGTTHRVRGSATFTGRRIGDAYPVPPPDPYYYGYDAITTTPSDAAFSTVRSAVARAVGWQ